MAHQHFKNRECNATYVGVGGGKGGGGSQPSLLAN